MKSDLERIIVAGDTHGNTGEWKFGLFPAAIANNAPAILQVGDFGYKWPGAAGAKYMAKVSRYAQNWDVDVYFIDGNHENFEALEEDGALGADEPVEVMPRIWYLPRGYAWNWQGMRLMALGGAYSVDKRYRTPYISWWPQEELTDADVERALQQQRCDIIFMHDLYDGPDIPGMHAAWKADFPAARANRHRLRTVVAAHRPYVVFHGHFHVGYENHDDEFGTHVVGLNMDGEYDNAVVLELPAGAVNYSYRLAKDALYRRHDLEPDKIQAQFDDDF